MEFSDGSIRPFLHVHISLYIMSIFMECIDFILKKPHYM